MDLDEKNCEILNLLQKDCRMSLTDIAKKVGLSVDSVKKRIEKLNREKIFFPKVQLRPRSFGYPYIVDVKIKLRNYNEARLKEFIDTVTEHPRVAEVFSISGEWNFSLVIFSNNYEDLARLSDELKGQFGDIIAEWTESLTTVVYKFENYDMNKLNEYEGNLKKNVQK